MYDELTELMGSKGSKDLEPGFPQVILMAGLQVRMGVWTGVDGCESVWTGGGASSRASPRPSSWPACRCRGVSVCLCACGGVGWGLGGPQPGGVLMAGLQVRMGYGRV